MPNVNAASRISESVFYANGQKIERGAFVNINSNDFTFKVYPTYTVNASDYTSDARVGQTFTDEIIRKVNEKKDPVVFILWGANAKAKIPLITNKNHLILYAAHPSPLSAYNGFFGCKHFSKTNEFLKEHGRKEIDWQIPNI